MTFMIISLSLVSFLAGMACCAKFTGFMVAEVLNQLTDEDYPNER